MAIVDMTKVQLLIHRSVATRVLDVVQSHGVMHLTDVTENDHLTHSDPEHFEFNYYASQLDFAVSFLEKFDTTGGLRKMIEGGRVITNRAKIQETFRSFYFKDIIATAHHIEQQLNKLDGRISERASERRTLLAWNELSIPLDTNLTTASTVTLPLEGRAPELASLAHKLTEAGINHEFVTGGTTTRLLTVHTSDIERAQDSIREHKIELVALPKRRGTPEQELERVDRADRNDAERREKLVAQAQKLAEKLPELKVIADYIHWKQHKHTVMSQAPHTGSVLAFEGWCPTEKLLPLKNDIEAISELCSLEELTPEADEQPPVDIKNAPLIQPFESITRLYGMPGYRDIDPTVFLAGFFFLFFGISLTDVGYGVAMVVLIAPILYFYTLPKGTRMLLTLLLLGGVASALVGFIFGGYFGADMALMPEWLQRIQLFDPIANPLPIFYLSLIIGCVQVMTGLILKIVREAKNNNLTGGLLDQVPWLALFVAIGVMIAEMVGLLTLPANTATILIVGSLLAIVVTQGRAEANIFMKGLKGTLSLYDFIGYFSDVLSYSRLLALGLATSALAFSVNMIATLVGELVPYVGFVFMALVLVVGHFFTLVVNTLGAFIHSARLQFVEFFGKFIMETGTEFRPFAYAERHVILEE